MELKRWVMGLVRPVGLISILILSGCSIGGSSGGASSQSILSQVLHRGTLRIGSITGNAPFESLDSSGNLVGYDIDVVSLLAKQMGVKAEFIKVDVPGRITILESHQADVVVGSFTRTRKRSQVISFSDPINQEYVALLGSADRHDINALSDFNRSGIKIAVATGSTQAAAVSQALPQAVPVQVPGIADELQAVTSGKADAAAVANT